MSEQPYEFERVFVGDLVFLNSRVFWKDLYNKYNDSEQNSLDASNPLYDIPGIKKEIVLRCGQPSASVNLYYNFAKDEVYSYPFIVTAILFIRKVIIAFDSETRKHFSSLHRDHTDIIENEWTREIDGPIPNTHDSESYRMTNKIKLRKHSLGDTYVHDRVTTKSAQQAFLKTEKINNSCFIHHDGNKLKEVQWELACLHKDCLNVSYMTECFYSETIGDYLRKI